MSSAKPAKSKVSSKRTEKNSKAQSRRKLDNSTNPDNFLLRLYVAGQTPRSLQALSNLKRICDEHLPGHYRVEVIDLLQKPQLAAGDQILAIPTLVRVLPKPARRIIGDLSNTERVLVGLDVRPVP